MLLKRAHFFLLSLLLLCHPQYCRSQRAVPVDTSDFLPYFINGALEYNLMIAAERGYYGIVERLIKLGAEVDAETADGATPLVFAVFNDNPETVKILLYYNADPDKVTRTRETPLMIAVKNQNSEVAEALLRYGAEVNYTDMNRATSLHYASIYGYPQMVDLLLYYEADIDPKTKDGTTPLMAAVWSGYPDVAELLIKNGANMEARDNDGFTPFLIASQNGDTLMMNLLIKRDVGIFEKNRFDISALGLAIRAGNQDATELLLGLSDRWSRVDTGSMNPYNVAAKYRRGEIAELLRAKKVPGKYRAKPDQFILTLAPKTNGRDFYTGIGFAVKEPSLNIGLLAGLDTKLWYTKVYIKEDDKLYYQYMDKSSVLYGGFYKDFPLTDNAYGFNVNFSASLMAAYSFGNKFKGTRIAPEEKINVIPSISLKWEVNNLGLITGIEYMNTAYALVSPFWGRVGLTYRLVFDNVRSPLKTIKWY